VAGDGIDEMQAGARLTGDCLVTVSVGRPVVIDRHPVVNPLAAKWAFEGNRLHETDV